MVYDTFLIAPLLMANSFILVSLFGPVEDISSPTIPSWLMQLTSFCVIIVFFSVFWRKSGQTLGMQAWRIKLVTTTGNTPSYRQCILRCVVATLSLGMMGLGYWWSIFDAQGRRWHDRASGTQLILLSKH
jgi:uncharacterized RDD family membrane protein YckC